MKSMLVAATLLALAPIPTFAGGTAGTTLRDPAPSGLQCLFVADRCRLVELKRSW